MGPEEANIASASFEGCNARIHQQIENGRIFVCVATVGDMMLGELASRSQCKGRLVESEERRWQERPDIPRSVGVLGREVGGRRRH